MSEKKVGSGDKIITVRLKSQEFDKLQALMKRLETDKSKVIRMGLNRIYSVFFGDEM